MPVLKPPGRSVALVAGVNEGEREGDRTEIAAVAARVEAGERVICHCRSHSFPWPANAWRAV